jgi:hypothetical protein
MTVRITIAAACLLAFSFAPYAQAAGRLILPPLQFINVHAYVTGYNTTPGQTDDTPCTAASGANICGRTDAVACPRRISLGTFLQIRGETYVCEDRLAKKYDSRFDISCDKDTDCPGQVTGWVDIKVFAADPCRLPPVATRVVPALTHVVATKPLAVLRSRFHGWRRA